VLSTGGRAAGGNPIAQLLVFLLNYTHFLSIDAWLLFGIVGLFLVSWTPARGYLLGAAALLGLVILKARTVRPSLHTVTPLLPLLALGAGVALAAAWDALFTWSAQWLAPLDDWLARRPTPFTPLLSGEGKIGKENQSRLSRALAAALVCVAIAVPL